jgi:Zn-dependent protease with chaperone function
MKFVFFFSFGFLHRGFNFCMMLSDVVIIIISNTLVIILLNKKHPLYIYCRVCVFLLFVFKFNFNFLSLLFSFHLSENTAFLSVFFPVFANFFKAWTIHFDIRLPG